MGSLRAPGYRRDYVVLEACRINGRRLEPGHRFNPRRMDIERRRLDELYRKQFICLADDVDPEETEPEEEEIEEIEEEVEDDEEEDFDPES